MQKQWLKSHIERNLVLGNIEDVFQLQIIDLVNANGFFLSSSNKENM